MGNLKLALVVVFLVALTLRFLYFPNNIYFGYDQARDAFSAVELAKGDLKIVGPSTSVEGLYHGAIYYYLIAPFYYFGSGNPEIAAAGLRVLNSIGVFLIFAFGTILFGRAVGLISAILFAISFEQTQFSIYLSNPAPASLTIPLIFLGLALVIFRKKYWGLALAFLGLGLSIQFEFALLYLVIPFLGIIVFNYKSFFKIPFKYWLLALLSGAASASTFILAEIKYSFRTLITLLSYSNPETNIPLTQKLESYLATLYKMGEFNIYNGFPHDWIFWLVLLFVFIYLLKDKELRPKLIFLATWFFSLILVYLTKGGYSDLYYTNIGISAGLLIFLGLVLFLVSRKSFIVAILLVLLIGTANLKLITSFNPKGTISQIHVQQGMLLSDEKEIIDRIYKDAKKEQFAVKALTMPYDINTTWSYLFEWYGNKEYGYLPLWNGQTAAGYPGNLQLFQIHEKLPEKRYVIIEPMRGVPGYLIDQFLREEGYFTNIEKEEEIGKFVLQLRKKK